MCGGAGWGGTGVVWRGVGWRVWNISARNRQIVTGSPLDWLNLRVSVTRLVASPLGGYLRIVHFLVCLPVLSVRRHLLRSIDRMVDRPVPLFVLNHRGSGVAVVGTTRLPIGCPSTNGLLPRRDGDRTRFIAWVRSVSVHW